MIFLNSFSYKNLLKSLSELTFRRCGDTKFLKLMPLKSEKLSTDIGEGSEEGSGDRTERSPPVNNDSCSETCPNEHNIQEICQTPPEVLSCDACEWKAYKDFLLWGYTTKYAPRGNLPETWWESLDEAKAECLKMSHDECGGILQENNKFGAANKFFVRKQRNCFTNAKNRNIEYISYVRPMNCTKRNIKICIEINIVDIEINSSAGGDKIRYKISNVDPPKQILSEGPLLEAYGRSNERCVQLTLHDDPLVEILATGSNGALVEKLKIEYEEDLRPKRTIEKERH